MSGWFGQTRKPLKRSSSKTAARDRRYRGERAMFLDSHGACEANIPHVCTGRASEVHHMAGRSASVFFDHSLWRALCHGCHVFVTDNPSEAMARGLSVRRNAVRP